MAETVYNRYKANLPDALEDWPTGDYRSLLLTGVLTINPDHNFVSDVLAANTEAADATYGRVALSGKTITKDDANDRAQLEAADTNYGALNNETPAALVVFRQVTVDADSPLASLHDTNFGVASNGAGYVVQWPNGVHRLT